MQELILIEINDVWWSFGILTGDAEALFSNQMTRIGIDEISQKGLIWLLDPLFADFLSFLS